MDKILADDELTAIRARAEAATDFGEGDYFEAHSWGDGEKLAFNLEGDLVATEQQVMADKAFLERARRDVLTLWDEVDRLRAELRETVDDLRRTSRWALKYKTELEKYDPGWFIWEDSDEEIERFNREFDEQRTAEALQ